MNAMAKLNRFNEIILSKFVCVNLLKFHLCPKQNVKILLKLFEKKSKHWELNCIKFYEFQNKIS